MEVEVLLYNCHQHASEVCICIYNVYIQSLLSTLNLDHKLCMCCVCVHMQSRGTYDATHQQKTTHTYRHVYTLSDTLTHRIDLVSQFSNTYNKRYIHVHVHTDIVSPD